jgi:hypothetical protein
MSNHVHLFVIPTRAGSLPLALKHTHGRASAPGFGLAPED